MKDCKLFKLHPPKTKLVSFQGEKTGGKVCLIAMLLKSAIHTGFYLSIIMIIINTGELSPTSDKSVANVVALCPGCMEGRSR